ncbi:MAG: tyrosine-protein phosphatase, partial [Pseudomonadota bacterium]
MKDRVKTFQGIRNFRDFGGYLGAGGRQIRSGVLFRSAQFGEATDADLANLEAFSITVQADLRRPDERERHGHRWPTEGVRVLKSDKGRAKDAPHVRFLERAAVDADEAREWMTDYYREAPYKEQHVDTFRTWFSELEALPDGQAAVVNCAAGKDRTGVLCALTHIVLGVDQETIMQDYLL